MKTTLLLAALVSSAILAPRAQAATACDTFVSCGSFSGEGSRRDTDGQDLELFKEKVEISSSDEKTALLTMSILGKDPSEQTFELTMSFQPDGSFVMTQAGRLYAAGICAKNVCTYGMRPFTWPGQEPAVANAGYIRFTKDGIERSMLVSAPDGVSVQTSILPRR